MNFSFLVIVFSVFATSMSGCKSEESNSNRSQKTPGGARFALEESSSLPAPSTSPPAIVRCPEENPVQLWLSVASGSGHQPLCTGGLGPNYATWAAEDAYNQHKASQLQTCADGGGTAIIGKRIWIPGNGECLAAEPGFLHSTYAGILCCGTGSPSPTVSPSPEEATECEVVFGPSYRESSTKGVSGTGSDAGCTGAKAASQTNYDSNLASTKNSCGGRTIEFGVLSSSRCFQDQGLNHHQRVGFVRCCINSTPIASWSPSPSPSATSSWTPSPSPSPSPSSTPYPSSSPY